MKRGLDAAVCVETRRQKGRKDKEACKFARRFGMYVELDEELQITTTKQTKWNKQTATLNEENHIQER